MKNFTASACVTWLASAKASSSSGTSPKTARTWLAISVTRSRGITWRSQW